MLLANADNFDATQTHLVLILLCLATVAVAAVLVGLIIVSARNRRHPHAAPLQGFTIVWAVLAAGSAIYATIARLNWEKSHQLEMLTGYGDPQDVPPKLPWALWGTLMAAYLVLLIWTLCVKNKTAPLEN